MLEVEGVMRSFGGLQAVDRADLEVGEGEIVGLIGPNGAGKTTLFNCITGAIRPQAGSIRFRGKDLVGLRPHRIARLGLIRSFQIPRTFEKMTILENMLLGSEDRRDTNLARTMVDPFGARRRERHTATEAIDRLDEFGFAHLAQEFASALSGGQRKLLELASALMSHPSLLLLDEPAAGVNPTLAAEIADKLLGLREVGITLLVIEHNLGFLELIADRVMVMAQGRMLTGGTMDEIRAHPEVLEVYLGASVR
jgi:ABC-type branched-subunit amino acid transport system ATPase component